MMRKAAALAMPTPELLVNAFARFNEASDRLEARYSALAREAESLREQLRLKDIEIKKAERLATLGETAAALAHEVRNPLGAIRLFVSLLKEDLADRPDSLEILNQVDTSVSALDGVVSNILQFAKGKDLALAPVNLHSIIEEQARTWHFAHPQVGMELDLRANAYLLGNEDALRQVFYNLCLNASQAMKFRGTICMSTTDTDTGGVRVTIADSGPGIPERLLATLFDPFVTGRNEGTGLGLAIVKKIIEQHRGTVRAGNRSQGGAEFEVLLPRR